jgi:hypothetical protein
VLSSTLKTKRLLSGMIADSPILRMMRYFVLGACVAGCSSPGKPTVFIKTQQPITISYTDTLGVAGLEDHPFIRGSINGVSGNFVVDTGSFAPMLTIAAARRCGFQAFWPPASEKTNSFWGEKIRMMKATNIVVELAPGFTVHWPELLVSGEEEIFGIVDYRTLKAANAVIDTRNRTITFRK